MQVSHERARRLIVFVHGFGGRATETWTDFAQSGRIGQWWQESDMLFVGYRSFRDDISSVADELREYIPGFYPTPHPEAMSVMGLQVRDDISSPYEELVLVGHSLGGLVIRCALVDAAQEWIHSIPRSARPIILCARTRLFSPASAGFRPAGLLGLAKALGILRIAGFVLWMSGPYQDLQPGSSMIAHTQERTEMLYRTTSEPALQASILWANPDEVVKAEWYATDMYRTSVRGQSHMTVCKPHDGYPRPWQFVETGR